MSTIKASEETKKRLFKPAGELQAKDGKRKTMEDVITFLIDHYYEDVTSKGNSQKRIPDGRSRRCQDH